MKGVSLPQTNYVIHCLSTSTGKDSWSLQMARGGGGVKTIIILSLVSLFMLLHLQQLVTEGLQFLGSSVFPSHSCEHDILRVY